MSGKRMANQFDGKMKDELNQGLYDSLSMGAQPFCFGLGGSMYVGHDGTPCKRTPFSHPYNYEEFVLWRKAGYNPRDVKADGSCYSDRLLHWDFDRHNELCLKHFGNKGQYWNERDPKLIEAFLRDWNDNQSLCLLEIIQGCNQSSGYPVWAFLWKDK